jgi:hypothetical protein
MQVLVLLLFLVDGLPEYPESLARCYSNSPTFFLVDGLPEYPERIARCNLTFLFSGGWFT